MDYGFILLFLFVATATCGFVSNLVGLAGGVSGGGGLSGSGSWGQIPEGASSEATGGNIGGDNKITPEGIRQEGISGPRGVNITFAKGGAMVDQSGQLNEGTGASLGLDKIGLPVAILVVAGLLIGFIVYRRTR